MFYIYIFCYAYFIVQRIDLDFRSMRYIKIDIIILINDRDKLSFWSNMTK